MTLTLRTQNCFLLRTLLWQQICNENERATVARQNERATVARQQRRAVEVGARVGGKRVPCTVAGASPRFETVNVVEFEWNP